MNMSVPPGRYLHHQVTLFGSSASILAVVSSPTLAGKFTKKSIPVFFSRSSTDIEYSDVILLSLYTLWSNNMAQAE